MGMSAEQKAAWLNARCGVLTASRVADALGDNGPGKRRKLLMEMLEERTTGQNYRHMVTPAMEHGLEYEDEMFDVFVERYPQYHVRASRLYMHPRIEYFGATPDREVGDDGLLEGKCPSTGTFLDWVLAGVVPEKHKPQMAAQLLCTGRKWCGFIAYDPRLKDERKRLFLRKFEPTPEYLETVEAGAVRFLADLETLFEAYTTA